MLNKIVIRHANGKIMKGTTEDFFPNKDKLDFAKRNVIPGKVILCRSDIADKDKRLVIIGISGDKKRVATLRFNTIKYFTKKKKTYENFIMSYNKLIRKIDNLINNDNTLKLDEIVN